jgi:hypothetical protein
MKKEKKVVVKRVVMSWSLFWFLAIGGLLLFVPLLGAGWLAGGLFLLYLQGVGKEL